MIAASGRWRNLGVAAGAATAVLFAAFDLYQWVAAVAADRFHNDFTFYYAAARVGLQHGWSSTYDLHLQQAQLDVMGSGITIAQLARYISPLPVAWAALPLTALPYEVAYWIWSALLLVALGFAWHLASPGGGRTRVVLLVAAVGWLPVIYGLQLGQPGLFIALGVAGSYALLRANKPWWAGLALAPIAFKPQLAFLVPPALLAARQYRAFAGSAIALGVLALASAVALGPSGISTYVDRINFAAGISANRELTLTYLIGDAARPAQVFVATWTILVVYRMRNRGLEWIYVGGLVGGMLASPYVHLDDLIMLGLAGWLALRAGGPSGTWAYVLGGVLAIEGEPIWGPLPVLAFELGALLLLSYAAITSRDVLSLPQIDARPLELHPRQ